MAKAVYCKDCIHHEECNAKRKEMGIVTFVEGLVDCEGYAVSKMIQCDQCKKTMYTDAREDKGAYVSMTADDPLYGFSSFHLCRKCYAEKFPWLVDEQD